MADLLIVDLEFLLGGVVFPGSKPVRKGNVEYLCVLDHIGKTNSSPRTISTDLSFLPTSHSIDLTRHSPSTLLVCVFNCRVCQV